MADNQAGIGSSNSELALSNFEDLLPVSFLAHQGGWDEALMVITPLAAIALMLAVANRRARQQMDSSDLSDVTADQNSNSYSTSSEADHLEVGSKSSPADATDG